MGDLISMTRANASFPIRPHTGGDAEILFFTGVRYHRVIDDEPPKTMTRSRRRQGKTDEIADVLRPDQQV